jgi:hypothetical protein
VIRVRRALVTYFAFSVEVGNILIHPRKVSTMVSRYFCQLAGSMWVKSICQSCSADCLTPSVWGRVEGLDFPEGITSSK